MYISITIYINDITYIYRSFARWDSSEADGERELPARMYEV